MPKGNNLIPKNLQAKRMTMIKKIGRKNNNLSKQTNKLNLFFVYALPLYSEK
jgi:hypothetical protein